MSDVFIKGEERLGHILTTQLRTNTGTGTFDGVTENTHTIVVAFDNLATENLVAASAGDSITDALIDDLYVTSVVVNGGDPMYTGWRKPVDSDTLTFTDGVTTLAISDTVDVNYLPDGTGDEYADIREKDIPQSIESAIKAAIVELETITNERINQLMAGMGYTRE